MASVMEDLLSAPASQTAIPRVCVRGFQILKLAQKLKVMDVDYDDLVKCPWCVSHEIIRKNLESHYRILKKQKNPCVKDLRNCKYNTHHKIHKNDMEKHYLQCADAEYFLQEDFTIPAHSFNQAVARDTLTNAVQYTDHCDETSWDVPSASKGDACFQGHRGESNNNSAEESITPTADIPMEASHSDVKKCIRKLEKKLKEIAKLENKGNLSKDEKDKIAKKNDLQKELEELKTRWEEMDL